MGVTMHQLLKTLVEQYIEGGQPIASKTLADSASVSVSPATVRNIMADLESVAAEFLDH